MKFCDILRELLEDNDITQKQLASDLNIGVTTIGNYVRGIREPDFETLKLIAKYFGVSTDYLLNFQNNLTLEHGEDKLLRLYRKADEEGKQVILELNNIIVKHSSKNN